MTRKRKLTVRNEEQDQQKKKKKKKKNKNTKNKLQISENININKKDQQKQNREKEEEQQEEEEEVCTAAATTRTARARTLSKLQEQFRDQLLGSRFRVLNEELYTTSSQDSYQKFTSNPQLFTQYHEGYQNQVKTWPVNPVNIISKSIIQASNIILNKNSNNNNNNGSKNVVVVADFGCGDAPLAKQLLSSSSKKFVVHSFDLVSPTPNPYNIVACDMAHVPLPTNSVNIAVFCLSLMGVNCADFIREAHRVLAKDGIIKIAEVRSRLEETASSSTNTKHDKNGSVAVDRTLLNQFVTNMKKLGFTCTYQDYQSNPMFIFMDFSKISNQRPPTSLNFSLKPCFYKRR